MEFDKFPKIPRLMRDIIITEKIDGTNAQIHISENGKEFLVGSRTRFINPTSDNYGFASWAYEHKKELLELGPGRHFGEWWGGKIGRGYGLTEKRFSLFNTSRWNDSHPACCDIVPVLYEGPFSQQAIITCCDTLTSQGSVVAPGFMRPEGIIIFHTASNSCFKMALENDEKPKTQIAKGR